MPKTRVRFFHHHRATLELAIGGLRPPDQNVEIGPISTVKARHVRHTCDTIFWFSSGFESDPALCRTQETV